MPPKVALFITLAFVVWVYSQEAARRVGVSKALLIPQLWFAVATSKFFGVWLIMWGIPVPGGGDPTEGSFIDRNFFLCLMICGLYVLNKRGFQWGRFFSENKVLVALIAFAVISVAWSDYPYVTIKRCVKLFGSIVMVLVVFTESNPVEAVAALIRRCAYFHLPLSIIVIRYFRHIGVAFDYSGNSESWLGLATSKNTLGQVAACCALYFVWEKFRNVNERKWFSLSSLYLLMALYLLKGSDDGLSMTSLSVFLIGLAVLVAIHYTRGRIGRIRAISYWTFAGVLALLVLLTAHSIFVFSEESLLGKLITGLGRDITLTGRTIIWGEVYEVASRSPLLGVGYGAFWLGEAVNIPFSARMTWTLGQAHNGYIDAYLQIGLIGTSLLVILIFVSMANVLKSFNTSFHFGQFRLVLLILAVFVNLTESTFLRSEHNMWIIFLLVALSVPYRLTSLPASFTASTPEPRRISPHTQFPIPSDVNLIVERERHG